MKYDFYITGTIGEQFDWWTGQPGTTSAQVKNFLKENKDKEVTIAVSSPGGYIDEGITIAELIADHGKCNMVIIGMTASAATILCMKAKSVKIARGSLMLIHNSSQYIYGNGFSNKKKIDAFIASLQKTRSELDTIDKALADFYSYRNGKSIEDNCAMMDQEKWMTAQEAVDFGIVDAILEDDDSNTQAKAINNVYAGYNGIEEHFGLPTLPTFDKPEPKVPKGIMAKLKNIFNDFPVTPIIMIDIYIILLDPPFRIMISGNKSPDDFQAGKPTTLEAKIISPILHLRIQGYFLRRIIPFYFFIRIHSQCFPEINRPPISAHI